MMNIIGMKQHDQVKGLKKTIGCNSMGVISKELRLGDVKRRGGQVFTKDDGYVVKGMSSLQTVAFVDLLKKENPKKYYRGLILESVVDGISFTVKY
jgi:hypothetical protein